MATQSLIITLAIVGVTCAIAVLLARRWQLHLAAAWLATLGWSIGCLVAYYFVLSTWPPGPWTAAALDAEPWESVVYPLLLLGCVWPVVYDRSKQWPSLCLIGALAATCLPIVAALCQTERFAPFFVGNSAWSLAALMAVGLNWMAMQRLESNGAGRWSLWIVVGQSMTVAALIMTCYGRFGEWATFTGITLGVVAFARIFVSKAEAHWSSSLALPALALNSVLTMHIREYRSVPLPLWFPVLPFLLPTLVAGLDYVWSGRLHPALRVVIAGVATAVLAAATVALMLMLNGPAEEW